MAGLADWAALAWLLPWKQERPQNLAAAGRSETFGCKIRARLAPAA